VGKLEHANSLRDPAQAVRRRFGVRIARGVVIWDDDDIGTT